MRDEVILVDTNDHEIGVMEKMEAHEKALLHRAFSVFLFNRKGDMLLQQRAFSKYHSGGQWTNTCCSHPRPGESTIDAANRRLQEEMGIHTQLNKVFDFTYQAPFDNGLVEHEYDHVFVGEYEGSIEPNPDEVADFKFESLINIEEQIHIAPQEFTPWFKIAFPKVQEWWHKNYTTHES